MATAKKPAKKKATPKKKTAAKKKIVYKRKTINVWNIYGYYGGKKEEIFTATSFAEARSVLKSYKENEKGVRFTYDQGRMRL